MEGLYRDRGPERTNMNLTDLINALPGNGSVNDRMIRLVNNELEGTDYESNSFRADSHVNEEWVRNVSKIIIASIIRY
jgi:hypothetical protein